MSFDRKCHDLARAFVDDSEIIGSRSTSERLAATGRIAQAVQTVIEDELAEIEEAIKQHEARHAH